MRLSSNPFLLGTKEPVCSNLHKDDVREIVLTALTVNEPFSPVEPRHVSPDVDISKPMRSPWSFSHPKPSIPYAVYTGVVYVSTMWYFSHPTASIPY